MIKVREKGPLGPAKLVEIYETMRYIIWTRQHVQYYAGGWRTPGRGKRPKYKHVGIIFSGLKLRANERVLIMAAIIRRYYLLQYP